MIPALQHIDASARICRQRPTPVPANVVISQHPIFIAAYDENRFFANLCREIIPTRGYLGGVAYELPGATENKIPIDLMKNGFDVPARRNGVRALDGRNCQVDWRGAFVKSRRIHGFQK
jgi:hypothetical protein